MLIQLKIIIKSVLGCDKLENNQLRINHHHILHTNTRIQFFLLFSHYSFLTEYNYQQLREEDNLINRKL
jgi:hypothetical protein